MTSRELLRAAACAAGSGGRAGRLLDDPGLRTEMTDAALRRAREHFSADAWLARLRETYLDVQPAL